MMLYNFEHNGRLGTIGSANGAGYMEVKSALPQAPEAAKPEVMGNEEGREETPSRLESALAWVIGAAFLIRGTPVGDDFVRGAGAMLGPYKPF